MLESISSVFGLSTHYITRLGLDVRLITADMLLELEKLSCKLDLLLREVLRVSHATRA